MFASSDAEKTNPIQTQSQTRLEMSDHRLLDFSCTYFQKTKEVIVKKSVNHE